VLGILFVDFKEGCGTCNVIFRVKLSATDRKSSSNWCKFLAWFHPFPEVSSSTFTVNLKVLIMKNYSEIFLSELS